MKLLPLALALAALCFAASTALAQPAAVAAPNNTTLPPLASDLDPPPPSGIGALVMGGVGIGLGTINLATIPVCTAEFYPSEATSVCIGMSIGIGVALLGVGIPSLVIGKLRRERYRAWRERHRAPTALLEGLQVVPRNGGGQLLLQARF